MSAINFPLTTDISSAANQSSSQNSEQLPAGGSGQSTVLRPDTVTLSAVFPPAPPVDAANFVQFQSPAQPALQAFPPAPAPTAISSAQLASASDATTTATTAPTLSQQEQLAQLNRVLEQLGINPQNISLDNRLALIKSANDPPALLNLVRTLGVLNEAATSEKSARLARTISRIRPRSEIKHQPLLRTNLKSSLNLNRPLRSRSQVRRRGPGSSPLSRRQARRRQHPQSKLVWPAMRLRSSRSCSPSFRTPGTHKTSPVGPVQALFLSHR